MNASLSTLSDPSQEPLQINILDYILGVMAQIFIIYALLTTLPTRVNQSSPSMLLKFEMDDEVHANYISAFHRKVFIKRTYENMHHSIGIRKAITMKH